MTYRGRVSSGPGQRDAEIELRVECDAARTQGTGLGSWSLREVDAGNRFVVGPGAVDCVARNAMHTLDGPRAAARIVLAVTTLVVLVVRGTWVISTRGHVKFVVALNWPEGQLNSQSKRKWRSDGTRRTNWCRSGSDGGGALFNRT